MHILFTSRSCALTCRPQRRSCVFLPNCVLKCQMSSGPCGPFLVQCGKTKTHWFILQTCFIFKKVLKFLLWYCTGTFSWVMRLGIFEKSFCKKLWVINVWNKWEIVSMFFKYKLKIYHTCIWTLKTIRKSLVAKNKQTTPLVYFSEKYFEN